MKDKIVVEVYIPQKSIHEDIEIPVNISANELIVALHSIYDLKINESNIFKYYLKTDNPKRLLRGNKTMQQYGLHDGTVIWAWDE